ncbi:MAG: 3'-5' exonuclease, partial [Comamonas sp.]
MTESKGFILTRHWRDAPAGTEIEFWLATQAGPKKVVLTAQTSVAFVQARHRDAVEAQRAAFPRMQLRPLALRTFHQEPVIGVYATHFRQLRKLARALEPQEIALLEADVRPHDRYLMERFITAGVLIEGGRAEGARIVDCRLKPVTDYRPVLKVVSLDIETSQHEALYSVALDGMAERVVFMLGEPPSELGEALDFTLVYCATRQAMIEQLNAWFERNDPDVILGWNVIQFDLRVLQKTADESGVKLLLGRERQPIQWRTHPGKQGYLFAPTPGRLIIDGIDALKAAVWSFSSFSLENVSQTLLGEGKAIGDAYDKMAEIERRYQQDKPALAVYNIRDCALVLRIFEKAKL